MRIMLDTNVLISMIFFPSQRFLQMAQAITQEHALVLSSFVLDELKAVAERKFPQRREAIDRFLAAFGYELVYTPNNMQGGLADIRDKNDYPVLYSAITENVDVLITGDKDFVEVAIEKPEILTPSAFIEKYL